MFDSLRSINVTRLEKAAIEADTKLGNARVTQCGPTNSHTLGNIYDHVTELQQRRDELTTEAVSLATKGFKVYELNAWVGVEDHSKKLARISAALAVLEPSPEYKKAVAVLEPLIAEKQKADNALADAKRDLHTRKVAVQAAEEAARKRALESVAKDAGVVAARKALAEIAEPGTN